MLILYAITKFNNNVMIIDVLIYYCEGLYDIIFYFNLTFMVINPYSF